MKKRKITHMFTGTVVRLRYLTLCARRLKGGAAAEGRLSKDWGRVTCRLCLKMRDQKACDGPRPEPKPYFCKLHVDGKACGELAEWQSGRGVTCEAHKPEPSIRLKIPALVMGRKVEK